MASRPIPLIIDNEEVETQRTFSVKNPKLERIIHTASSASVEDAIRAVESAQRAFEPWSETKLTIRRDILLRAADIFVERKEELIRYQLDATDAGEEFSEFTFDLAVGLLRDIAGRVSSIEGSVPSLADNVSSGIVYKEPYGVILGIAPWNAPYALGTRAVAVAIATGNTTILKGSELSPQCFWAIGDIFRQAGLPAGVLNVIYHCPADAAVVTSALIAHPYVKKINFTGSTAVGSIIASIAGNHVKPVLLELGGKASCIVLDDADLPRAAKGCVSGAFLNGGQVCMSTERIIVQRSVATQFRELVKKTAEELYGCVDNSIQLISEAPVRKNRSLVVDAVSKGASLLYGTVEMKASSVTSMAPIIIDGVTKEMEIYETESFGPTVSLFVVESEEEAIKIANDTQYGLTAAVYTEDLRRGLRVAKKIESGAVHINSMTIHDEPSLPHGGVKASGFGRFSGKVGFDEFLRTKAVTWIN
ncbi:Vanillin dehydrogenase [Talaromyces pinophilus]|nr:Vanillin dehydrogenase [Talaromyces pinophilus]